MEFLEIEDFTGIIGVNTFTSLRGALDVNLVTAEELAFSELDPLYAKYDIAAELAKTADGRNSLMIRMMVHITAYYLFNTVDDNDIPERIAENYDNQIKTIAKIASGAMSCTLIPLLNEDSTPKTSYRFGGDALRDNDIF